MFFTTAVEQETGHTNAQYPLAFQHIYCIQKLTYNKLKLNKIIDINIEKIWKKGQPDQKYSGIKVLLILAHKNHRLYTEYYI